MSSQLVKHLGVPLVGGLSLATTLGCGSKEADGDLLGRWNLVAQANTAPGSIEQALPYAFNYTQHGDECILYDGSNLEVDGETMGRLVNIVGYQGCGELDGLSQSPRDVPITIEGDGLSFELEIGSPSNPGDGAPAEPDEVAVVSCVLDGALLACESAEIQSRWVFARPLCADDADCSDTERCLLDRCITPSEAPDNSGGTTTD